MKQKKNDGKNFEFQTKIFFSYVFEKIGYIIHKERIQFNGTQDGFDIQFVISEDYIERKIFIECKDYSTDLKFGNIYTKAHDLEANYEFDENDIALFISPKANFSNSKNPEKSEPILNSGKFPFSIRLLDLSNGVKNLFGINQTVFEGVYGYKSTENINKEYELNKFKNTLHSRGVLKKIIIKEKHRYDYITDIQETENHINRTITEPKYSKNGKSYFPNEYLGLNHISNLKTLVSGVFVDDKTNGVVLLGNPGLGKSVELKQLALYYWKNRELENCIPFFRTINSFLSTSNISDYLPKDWQHIPKMLIILDGLDEISDIQIFKAKLDKFIIDQKEKLTDIKFVLSCRTNIYESVIKDIPGFKCYALDELRPSEAFSFLEKKYSLSYEVLSKSPILDNQREFLSNPYFLNLFGEYYQTTNLIPTNKCDLITRYTEKRLEDDRVSKYKNQSYDSSLIKSHCKKVALSMEAMQVNKIDDSYLNILIDSKKTFTDCCFIEKVYGEDRWKFEHRNLQEFFVAKALSNLSFEKIIQFISVDDSIQKTHPSWLNSISFLINLLDTKDKKYDKLIKWLKVNDYDVLFKTDSNRISKSIQTRVFQDFFNKRCKKQTLWIGVYTAETKELAMFGDCIENLNFLISEIRNNENHRRARISALNILSYMSSTKEEHKIKEMVLALLSAPINEVDFNFKADVLLFVKNVGWHKDSELIHNIIKALGDFDYHLVTNWVLKLINNNNPDEYYDFIAITAPKVIDDNKRTYNKKDRISTSEKDTLKEILSKFEIVEHLLFSLKIHFSSENHYTFNTNEDDIEKIIFKIIKAYDSNKDIYNLMVKFLIDSLNSKELSYKFEDVLTTFFHKTKTNEIAFNHILNSKINYPKNLEFEVKRHFLASLASSKNLTSIVEKYINKEISNKELTYFRNNLSYQDYELAKQLQNEIYLKTSFDFNGDFLKDEIKVKWQNFHNTKKQKGFNLLFNRNEILDKVNTYFLNSDKDFTTWEELKDNKEEYWQSINLQTKYPQTFMSILHNGLAEFNGKLTKVDIISLIDSELYLINKIKNQLVNIDTQIEINEIQIEYIEKWCINNIPKADFNDLNSSKNNKLRCHLIWYFRNRFDFSLQEDVLLDMLNIDGSMKTNEKEVGYDYIIKNVNNSRLNKRLIKNINSLDLQDNIFENQAILALNNGLTPVYEKIRKFIKDEKKSQYYRRPVLKLYIEKTNDISLLKELIKPQVFDEYKDDLTWEAVDILLQKDENSIVIKKLLELRNKNHAIKNKLTIIKYLIKANYEGSFQLFNEWIVKNMSEYKKELNYSLTGEYWKTHYNSESIPHLIDLIKIGNSRKYHFDKFSKPIRIASDTLKNICQKNPHETCLKLIDLLKDYEKEFEKTDEEVFYFNTLLNDIWEIYFKLKSLPITFSEIAKKINEYKYEIV